MYATRKKRPVLQAVTVSEPRVCILVYNNITVCIMYIIVCIGMYIIFACHQSACHLAPIGEIRGEYEFECTARVYQLVIGIRTTRIYLYGPLAPPTCPCAVRTTRTAFYYSADSDSDPRRRRRRRRIGFACISIVACCNDYYIGRANGKPLCRLSSRFFRQRTV